MKSHKQRTERILHYSLLRLSLLSSWELHLTHYCVTPFLLNFPRAISLWYLPLRRFARNAMRSSCNSAPRTGDSPHRSLSIAIGPIASPLPASSLIKSSPVIQEGRPFARGDRPFAYGLSRSYLSDDSAGQHSSARRIIALCTFDGRCANFSSHSNECNAVRHIDHVSPVGRPNFHLVRSRRCICYYSQIYRHYSIFNFFCN